MLIKVPKMPRDLGDFEYHVLSVLMSIRGDAYGVPIREKLDERLKRTVSVGALYTTLDRLAAKRYVTTWVGEKTAERGGRAKKYFAITGAGEIAVRAKEQALAPFLAGWVPAGGVA